MRDSGIGSWVERRARVAPDRWAIICGDRRVSYQELSSRVRRLAHGLRSLGVERGDRVGWYGPNHPVFLELLFAASKLGAVTTPINHRLTPEAARGIVEDAAPKLVLVDASLSDSAPGEVPRVAVGGYGDPQSELERLVADASDAPLDEEVGLGDLCMLPYTSGTTGPPKGIMLTHGNVTWNVFNLISCSDFRADDVTIAIAPFFRTGGTGVNVLPVLFRGGTVVVPERVDPDEILRLVVAHRVTIGFGNPDLLEALTRSSRWADADLSSIRVFMTGGAPVPERLVTTYLARGVTFLQGFGLSEAAPFVAMLDPESALGKVGSAGRPAHFVDMRIVRPDGGACSPGEIGELLVQGPNVMAGYWNRAEASEAALENGWLRTGDAVRMDDEGFLYVVGRVADAYPSGGELVHPGDAERLLLSCDDVAEVCVVGRASGAVAYVVRAAGSTIDEETLLAVCREGLAPRARPATIRFVEGLPRNPGGKIMRHLLLADDGETAVV